MSHQQQESQSLGIDLLSFAVYANDYLLVEQLLKNKADPNGITSKHPHNVTPLEFAIYHENSDIVRLLVDKEADTTIRGHCALKYALSHYCELLKKLAHAKMHPAFFTSTQEEIITTLDARLARLMDIISFLAEHASDNGIQQRAQILLSVTCKDVIKQQEYDLDDQQIQEWFTDSEVHAKHVAIPLVDLKSKTRTSPK
jgi:ankyrin repeat protein